MSVSLKPAWSNWEFQASQSYIVTPVSNKQTSKQTKEWDGSAVNSIGCSCKWLGLSSQHPHDGSLLWGIWCLSLAYADTSIHMVQVHRYTCRQNTQVHKIIILKKWSRVSCSQDWPHTCCVAEDDLELGLLTMPAEGWECRRMLLCLVLCHTEDWTQVWCMLNKHSTNCIFSLWDEWLQWP